MGNIINGQLTLTSISLSKLVDAAAEVFHGDQKAENKFRRAVEKVLNESDNTELVEAINTGAELSEIMGTWLGLNEHGTAFVEFANEIY